MKPKNYDCTIIRAIDGDTFEVAIDCGWKITYNAIIRILGINSAEIHESNEEQKKLAMKAFREAQSFNGQKATVTAYNWDKYGRRLCSLHIDSIGDYAGYMLKLKLATPYNANQ